MSKLTLKTEGDTHVVVTRHFVATPEAVFRAHTEPALQPAHASGEAESESG